MIHLLIEKEALLIGTVQNTSFPQFCLTLAQELEKQKKGGQNDWGTMAFTFALLQKNENIAGNILDKNYPLPDTIKGLSPKAYCEQHGLNQIAARLP